MFDWLKESSTIFSLGQDIYLESNGINSNINHKKANKRRLSKELNDFDIQKLENSNEQNSASINSDKLSQIYLAQAHHIDESQILYLEEHCAAMNIAQIERVRLLFESGSTIDEVNSIVQTNEFKILGTDNPAENKAFLSLEQEQISSDSGFLPQSMRIFVIVAGILYILLNIAQISLIANSINRTFFIVKNIILAITIVACIICLLLNRKKTDIASIVLIVIFVVTLYASSIAAISFIS